MAFIETRLPQTIACGAVAGPRFRTAIQAGVSGAEDREDLWSLERGAWDVGFQHRTQSETLALVAFFYAVACGRAHGFRFADPAPEGSTGTLENLGTGDGATATFQLRKLYTLDGEQYLRTITKPVAGSVTMRVNGVIEAGVSVSTSTGIVTFNSAPGNGLVVTASLTFDIPVRFDTDWLDLTMVEPEVWSWGSVPLVEIRDIA